jgi:WD40 repeat protein
MKANSVFVFLILFSTYLFCGDIPDRIEKLEQRMNSSETFLNDSEKSKLLQEVEQLKRDLKKRVSSSDDESDFLNLNQRLDILLGLISQMQIDTLYTLVFADGAEKKIKEIALKKSETLKNLIEGVSAQEDSQIDLQRIDKETGERIVQLLEIIVANPDSLLAKLKEYNLQIPDLLNLIKAAHYLDIRVLEDALIQFCNSKYATDEDFNIFLLQSLKVDIPENFLVSMLKARSTLVQLNKDRSYWDISISADGNTIVARGYDGYIYIFDRAAGNKIGSDTTRRYLDVSISADGNTIVARGYDRYIYIFDRAGKQIGSNTDRRYSSISISADGNTIVAMGVDRYIYILSYIIISIDYLENLLKKAEFKEVETELKSLIEQLKVKPMDL